MNHMIYTITQFNKKYNSNKSVTFLNSHTYNKSQNCSTI